MTSKHPLPLYDSDNRGENIKQNNVRSAQHGNTTASPRKLMLDEGGR
jgi:hypothetical protein